MSIAKETIRAGIINNRHGIYTRIVKHYHTDIKTFGVQYVIPGIAKDLGVDNDKINVSSLMTAYKRFIKKYGSQPHSTETIVSQRRIEVLPSKKPYEPPKDDEISFF